MLLKKKALTGFFSYFSDQCQKVLFHGGEPALQPLSAQVPSGPSSAPCFYFGRTTDGIAKVQLNAVSSGTLF